MSSIVFTSDVLNNIHPWCHIRHSWLGYHLCVGWAQLRLLALSHRPSGAAVVGPLRSSSLSDGGPLRSSSLSMSNTLPFPPKLLSYEKTFLFSKTEYYAKGRWCRTLMMWVWLVGRDERAKCFWSARRHSLLLWPWCIDKQTDFTIFWETFWHPFIIMGCETCCWTSLKILFFSTELLDQP